MACVSHKWAGVDKVWEQEKLEASLSRRGLSREKCLKMPQNPTRQVHTLLGGVLT
ncbi:MAG: hypothetical protein HZB19_07760 [Chloroflexi bacterium]|nr:hypothetical protein [Chloroflexota bacterium]